MNTVKRQSRIGSKGSEVIITKNHLIATGGFQRLMARADILAVVEGRHSADFVRRVAWEITDPEDRKGLCEAAQDYGNKEVINKIAERTGITWKRRTTDTRHEVEVGELEVEVGRKIRITRTVRWWDKAERYIMARALAN